MSRIHDALKKAEQERAALHVSVESAPPARGAGAEVMAAPPAAAGSTPLTFASHVLARCASTEWKPDPASMLFMNGDDQARGMEEFRTLRSRLYQVREKMTLKVLLVTSALPKEGKSFTAANLAYVLARQHERKILLIDADLRGPQLHRMLGTAGGPGLSDYLEGMSDEFSGIQRGALPNLFFIPGGTLTGDPSELLANGRIRALLLRVGPLFDWIIVDSPSVLPVSDASVLAQDCDGVLLVVRSNTTAADVARKARQSFPEELIVGMVLNGSGEEPASSSRASGGSYTSI